MSLSITNANNSSINYNTNFKGKWDKTNEGTPYYKTSSGLKAGAVLAVPAALIELSPKIIPTSAKDFDKLTKLNKKDKEIIDKSLKDAYKESPLGLEQLKISKKKAIPLALIASGLSIGCGAIVDNIRNKKAENVANITKELGIKKTIMTNDSIDLSTKGRTFYDSNVGSKYGALLGLGCGVIYQLASYSSKLPKQNLFGRIFGLSCYALGGWIMGKIADHNTNKDAHKHA